MSMQLTKIFKSLVDIVLEERKKLPPLDAQTKEKHKFSTYVDDKHVSHGVSPEIDKIKSALVGKGIFGGSEIHQIKRELLFDYFLNGVAHEPYLAVLEKINDPIGKEIGTLPSFAEVDSWKEAISAAFDFLEINPQLQHYDDASLQKLHVRQFSVSQQARYLKTAGYKITIENGRLHLDEGDYVKVSNRIDELVKTLGGFNVYTVLINSIDKVWDEKLSRFHIGRRPTNGISKPSEPSIPWGYLFNLTVKYPYAMPIDEHSKKSTVELFELATASAAIFDVQPYTIYEGMFNNINSIIYYLREIAVYDTLFLIKQIRFEDVIRFSRILFSQFNSAELEKALGWSIENALKVFEEIFKKTSPFKINVFRKEDIYKLVPSIKPQEVETILNAFSHIDSANKTYSDPNEYPQVNFQFQPLIKINGNEYLILNPSFSAGAIYETVTECIRATQIEPQLDSKIGLEIEDAIKNILREKSVTFHCGKYQGLNKRTYECDLVIETDKRIVFVEIKKKPLTRKSKSGDVLGLLIDVSGSLISSQTQLGEHEVFLRQKQKMTLVDGDKTTEFELRGREIEKISLALDDYGSIQDRGVVHQILVTFASAKFDTQVAEQKEAIEKLSAKCKRMNEELQALLNLGVKLGANPFFNCWFLSVYQFLVLLDDVTSNEGLAEELKRTRSITFKTLDFYYEYSFLKPKKA